MKTPLKRIKTTIVIFKTNCTQESIYWHVQSNRFRNKWGKNGYGKVERLIKQLGHQKVKVRANAAGALGNIGGFGKEI